MPGGMSTMESGESTNFGPSAYRRLSLSSELHARECALIAHSIVNEFGADKSRAVTSRFRCICRIFNRFDGSNRSPSPG